MSEGTTIWWVQAAALLPIPCGMSTKEEVDKDLKPSQTRCCVSQWQAICCSIGCSLAGICVHNLTWIVYTPYLFLPTIQPWWIIFPTFHFETTTCKWKSFGGLASPCSYNKSQESVRVLRSEKILILLPLVTSVCEIWMQNQWYVSDMVRTDSLQYKPPLFKKSFGLLQFFGTVGKGALLSISAAPWHQPRHKSCLSCPHLVHKQSQIESITLTFEDLIHPWPIDSSCNGSWTVDTHHALHPDLLGRFHYEAIIWAF